MRDHAVRDDLVVRRRSPEPGLAVVTAIGEVDLTTAPRLRRALSRARERTTVVDLTGVTFLAAAGLTVLLAANDEAIEDGRRFGLVGAAGGTRRSLEVSGVAELVPSYPTVADAIP
jgi:anti-sigma B factor antagonist